MGRAPIPESPQGYPNQHDNPLSPPPPLPPPPSPQDPDMAGATRSYVSQSPETYPPPQPEHVLFPPPQPEHVLFPPPQPEHVLFPPALQQYQNPVQYPPPQQQPQNPGQYPPPQQQAQPQYYSNYPNALANGVSGGYQTPMRMDGVTIGGQYPAPTQGWSKNNGLFDCAEDPENAIITACFPCITFGQIAEVVDNGQTSCATSGLLYTLIAAFIGIPCIMSCSYRTKIRYRYGLMETPAPDWVTHCFCEWCALCQEYRELKARGLDPAIGWQGNMVRNQQQNPAMNPPMNQRMM